MTPIAVQFSLLWVLQTILSEIKINRIYLSNLNNIKVENKPMNPNENLRNLLCCLLSFTLFNCYIRFSSI